MLIDKIVDFVLLLTVPAILWIIPATRKKTGSWLTALKSVPVGCLIIVFLPELIFLLFKIKSDLFNFISFGLCFALGISVIVFAARWIWKHFHAEGKRYKLPFVFIFLCLQLYPV